MNIMERIKAYGQFILIGAGSYWGTDAIIQLVHPPHYIWIFLLTFGVPFVVFAAWYHLYRKTRYAPYSKGFPLFMLLGIWALGPLAIAVTMQAQGGKFLDVDNIQGFFMLWAAFPATTFMMSTYSGSLGGLIITTIMLFLLAIVAGRKPIGSALDLG